jgi:hypothetical protein
MADMEAQTAIDDFVLAGSVSAKSTPQGVEYHA